MSDFSETEALQLAGKLAVTCQAVLRADAFNVSDRISRMAEALRLYDEYIIAWTNATDMEATQ